MSEINRWSTSAAGTVQNAAGYFPEGQAPSTLNDAARTIMAELRRDWQTHNPDVTATFSAQTYSVTYGRNLSAGELSQVFCFIPDSPNTGTASLNVNSLGAKEIVTFGGSHLPAGAIIAQQPAVVVYNKSLDKFHLGSAQDFNPAYEYLTNIGGTDTIVGTAAYSFAAYREGQEFHFRVSASNATTTPTLNVNGVGAVTITRSNNKPLAPGDLGTNVMTTVRYNGTTFEMLPKGLTTMANNTTTGASTVDLTGLPDWVRRVTLLIGGIKLSGSTNLRIQLGTGSGIESSSYTGAEARITSSPAVAYTATSGQGFDSIVGASTRTVSGKFVFDLITGNTWQATWTMFNDSGSVLAGTGQKTLSAALSQVRITNSGSDTFSSMSATLSYE